MEGDRRSDGEKKQGEGSRVAASFHIADVSVAAADIPP